MTPVLRAGFEGSGSPRWLMRTLQRDGLDRAHGFRLDLCLLAENEHRHGTLAAVADGRADLADADWLALARARADGLPVTAVHPYGRILGSLVAACDFAGEGLPALRGRRLGVLSTADKNWAILRTACADLHGFDLDGTVSVHRAPDRAGLVALLEQGLVDAALVHWHLVPGLAAGGHRVLAELPELADALGAQAAPTTFFVVHEQLAAGRPALVDAFIAATRAAVSRLDDDPTAWAAIAEEIGGEAVHRALAGLRQRWRQRVAGGAGWDRRARSALEALRARLAGGAPAAGELPGQLPAGSFDQRCLP